MTVAGGDSEHCTMRGRIEHGHNLKFNQVTMRSELRRAASRLSYRSCTAEDKGYNITCKKGRRQ